MELRKTEQLLDSLREDIMVYGDYLKEISEACRKEKISDFPIFVAHQEPSISLGQAIIIKEQSQTAWSINASHLEDFVNRNLVDHEKELNFTQIYKDPDAFVCVFVLTPEFSNFIFCPYL